MNAIAYGDNPFKASFAHGALVVGNGGLRELDSFEIDAVSGALNWAAVGHAALAGAIGGAVGGAAGGAITGLMAGGIGAGPGAAAGFVGGGIAGGIGGAVTEIVIEELF